MNDIKKEVKQVVKGSIGKRSTTNKLVNNFLESDTHTVKNYIFQDVLIPAAKETINNMVMGTLNMLFWGDTRSSGSNTGGSMYRNYNGISNPSNASYYVGDRRTTMQTPVEYAHDSVFDYQNIEFATKGDAEMALDTLTNIIATYDRAYVRDLYEIAGLTPNNTDDKYGWTDISEASSYRTLGGGYRLRLPRVQQLD
jgi:hypothetical protein